MVITEPLNPSAQAQQKVKPTGGTFIHKTGL